MPLGARRQVDDGEGCGITDDGGNDRNQRAEFQRAQEYRLVQRVGEEVGVSLQRPPIGGAKALREENEDRHEKDRRRKDCGGQGQRQSLGPILKHSGLSLDRLVDHR